MEDSEEDVKFIADETLDCGGLSPSDSHEEEDIAVLATPEKPLRRGLSHRSNPNTVASAPHGVRFSLGPLSPEKLEEILEEANRLAAQLEQCALQERESSGEGLGPRRGKPSPRRETFVLKDSPVRDLLPTVSSLAWSTPSPSSLTPRLRSADKKGAARALRVTSGKRPSPVKRESPTCNLFPASKSPAWSPLVQSPLARSIPPLQSTPVRSTPVRPTPPSQPTPPLRSTPPPRSAPSPRSAPPPRSTPPNRSTPPIRSTPPHRSTPPVRSAPPRGKAGPSLRTTASPPTPVRPVLPSTSNTQCLPRPQGAATKTSSRLPVPSAIPRPPCRMPLTSRSVPAGKGALPSDSLSSRKGFSRSNAAGHKAPLSQQSNLAVRGATRSSLQPPKKLAVPGPAR